MPSFWDSLKQVGIQAASTAGTVYQSSLGAFSGVAKDKINQVANSVQSQVGNITKPPSSQPAPAAKPIPAPTPQQAGLGIAGIAIVGVAAYLLLRKK